MIYIFYSIPPCTTRKGDKQIQLSGETKDNKIIILGAGIAGMSAAYELGKVGYKCTVLESRDLRDAAATPRANALLATLSRWGRCWTVRKGTQETEIGG